MDISITASTQAQTSYPIPDLLKERLRLGEIIPARVIETTKDRMAVINLKGFNLETISELPLQRNEMILLEVKALYPRIQLRLIDNQTQPYPLPTVNQQSRKDYYITTLYHILPGIDKGEVKIDYQSKPAPAKKGKSPKIELLLQMSELGTVAVKIDKDLFLIEVEDEATKQLIENHEPELKERLRMIGLPAKVEVNYQPYLKDDFHDRAWIDVRV